MPPDRAVLFDLDDTLYPLRHFVLSGFRAVAADLEREMGINRRDVIEVLVGAAGANRGRELQILASAFGWSPSIVHDLVHRIRTHTPDIQLPHESARALALLRPHWRLGIVTNGLPAVQKRKVEVLGLVDAVDTIIYAADHGTGRGKPERAPFMAAGRELGIAAARTVFVGDDERCDVFGAARAGMRTVCLASAGRSRPGGYADAVASTLLDVPHLAAALVPVHWSQDVA